MEEVSMGPLGGRVGRSSPPQDLILTSTHSCPGAEQYWNYDNKLGYPHTEALGQHSINHCCSQAGLPNQDLFFYSWSANFY